MVIGGGKARNGDMVIILFTEQILRCAEGEGVLLKGVVECFGKPLDYCMVSCTYHKLPFAQYPALPGQHYLLSLFPVSHQYLLLTTS